ncbi:class I tRNA ligase family protein [Candidatus Vidania fulgoroideorum]
MKGVNKYNPRLIEKHYIRNKHKEIKIVKQQKRKRYICISMFPYPSGKLHMGHIRNYLINDVICRYKNISSNKKSVMYFGWDAFGLPAENAAIKNNITPSKWTRENIKIMKNQVKQYLFIIDWKYEINTSNISFYKWTQYFFFKLYKNRYIYKRKYLVNWDPIDKTTLSDEQVTKNIGWRSGIEIKKKLVESYFVSVKKISKELEENLYKLKWHRSVIQSQLKWIGKKKFYYCYMYCNNIKVKVYFEDIYYIISKVKLITSIRNYCEFFRKDIGNYKQASTYFKTKFKFRSKFGLKVSRSLFIVADDNEYSKYDIFILVGKNIVREVIKRIIYKKSRLKVVIKEMLIGYTNIKSVNRYKIRDWCISRQRTWGTPIPIVKCIGCKKEYVYKNTVNNIKKGKLSKRETIKNSIIRKICKYCSKELYKETDTLDTFFDSSWYFLMYIKKNNIKISGIKKYKKIDIYIGGKEHNILHLIYVRIFFIILKKLEIVVKDEPIKKLITQGMVLTTIKGKKVKMSKSIGTNIDTSELANKYGVDCVRMYTLFSGPIEKDILWDSKKISGSFRYIKKLWSFFIYKAYKEKVSERVISSKLEEKKEEIGRYYNSNKYNKVISKTMEMFNIINTEYNKGNSSVIYYYFDIVLILYPICPCFTSAIWKLSGREKTKGYIYIQKLNIESKRYKTINIYINGKVKEIIKKKREYNYYKYKYIKKYKIEGILDKHVIIKRGIINFLINDKRTK